MENDRRYYDNLERDFRLLREVAVLDHWKEFLGVAASTALLGLNVIDAESGATQFSRQEAQFNYRGWQVGVYQPQDEQIANVAVIIVEPGRHVESVKLAEHAPKLHIRAVRGSGILLVSTMLGTLEILQLDAKVNTTHEVSPGSVYSLIASRKENQPLIVTDFCSPPFVAGMETPLDADIEEHVFESDKAETQFWQAYHRLS